MGKESKKPTYLKGNIMTRSSCPKHKGTSAGRTIAALVISASVLLTGTVYGYAAVRASGAGSTSASVASSSVFTSMDATAFNITPQPISSGTLMLVGTPVGVGFTTAITAMAPADTVNRFVSYQNSGNPDAQALTLALADSGTSLFSADGLKGLQVIVTACTVAWVVTTGCSGTSTVLLTTTALSLKTTPGSLVAGTLTAASWEYLKFSITLPAATETTRNGVLISGTVQGLSGSLTWTLRELQRTATTTNS